MVRCKFRCNETKQHDSPTSVRVPDDSPQGFHWENKTRVLHSVVLTPVYSERPDSENKRFWDATPSGKLEFSTIKEMPFEVGKEYYLDISPAE